MGNTRKSWTESLTDVLASWGLVPRTATPHAQRAVIEVYGPVPHREQQVLVGTLVNEVGEYVFHYDAVYAACEGYVALAAFPDKQREYRSRELWPFFSVRLPPLDRPDVQLLIRERNIDAGDTMRLLAELGRRTITTPYELRYDHVAA